jgi:hypothetical protein
MTFFFAALFIAEHSYARISISNKVIIHEFTSSVCLPPPILLPPGENPIAVNNNNNNNNNKPLREISLVSKEGPQVCQRKRIVKFRKAVVLETWD